MPRYAALLRAINVGGHTVTMARLRGLFVDAGFDGVETLIASGNVIFDAPRGNTGAIERRIERQLETALGYGVATFIRTHDELSAIVAERPYTQRALAETGVRLFIAFSGRAPTAAEAKRVLGLRAPTDDLVVKGREIFWLCRASVNDAAVSGALLEKTLGMPVTVRNITTVRKLAERTSGDLAG